MLELKDFIHLPELDPIIEQLAADGPGLIVVAGLDTPSASGDVDGFLPLGSPRGCLAVELLSFVS